MGWLRAAGDSWNLQPSILPHPSVLPSCLPSLACLQVFQGIILAQRDRFAAASAATGKPGSPTAAFGGAVSSPEGYLLGLWAHECQRVFADKLITLEDKAWVESTVAELAKQVRRAGRAWRGVLVSGGWEGALLGAESLPMHPNLQPAACHQHPSAPASAQPASLVCAPSAPAWLPPCRPLAPPWRRRWLSRCSLWTTCGSRGGMRPPGRWWRRGPGVRAGLGGGM